MEKISINEHSFKQTLGLKKIGRFIAATKSNFEKI